ncbi:hypothetical protein Rhopal_002608-T1 [Rhodotorula paludigena]|uniref:BZIP domain-containing protein n=1 Tax=Rhodotorula paludigena TaxID=86838 RepID=A0AAV5GJE3_9BASI|nr:hypothetical protein Rhopal_002608-T1 [Rhodotorula paludigena]
MSTSFPVSVPTAPTSAPPPVGLDAPAFSALLSLSKEQAEPQPSMTTKSFDAGDILLPFDLEPASVGGGLDVLAYPVFSSEFGASSSSAAAPQVNAPGTVGLDPLVLDGTLESPLGLGSTSTSPLSEFLASPMFGMASESTVPSATMSELPLPSPYEAAMPAPSSAVATEFTGLPWFPPLPSGSESVLFGSPLVGAGTQPAVAVPTSSTTFLRPNPVPSIPPPHALTPVTSALPSFAPPPPTPALSSTSSSSKRPKPTGFRAGSTPLLALDAPIQPRNSVLPSATSRKRKTSAAEKALAKRAKTSPPLDALDEAAVVGAPAATGGDDGDELPEDIKAAVERKRLQNTLSARKSRARKQARLQELEGENDALKQRVAELEALLGLAATHAPSASA